VKVTAKPNESALGSDQKKKPARRHENVLTQIEPPTTSTSAVNEGRSKPSTYSRYRVVNQLAGFLFRHTA
jgi:hypothetical protein